MKKLFLSVAAFAAAPLFAQDMTGSWQGTLQLPNGGRELRTVVKVTKEAADFKAMFYSIDQGGQGLPVSSFTLNGPTVKFAIPGIGGEYEGKLAPDAKSIAGTWSQGPGKLTLNLVKATPETAWVIPEPPPRLKPMAADANAVFEVATIKPSKPGAPGKAFRMNGRQFSTLNTSVVDIMTFAYGIHPKQIIGAPDWSESDRWDIQAEPEPEGAPSGAQLRTMMQKLLADRYQLKFHRDKKELSVYAITVAKGGPKLTKSEGDPNGLPALFFRGLGQLPARNATMADLAGIMQGAVLDRPVVDQTGIAGRWDFTLNWTPDQFQFTSMGVKIPPPPDDAQAPDLFTAFQQQLGLKLETAKAPAEVFVIDKVEKPSAN